MPAVEQVLRKIVSATRLHLPQDADEIPEATQQHLRAYVAAARKLRIKAAIAVNSHKAEVERIAAEVAPDCHLQVLHVPCWGAFVPALNALLGYAQQCNMTFILYQSLEVQCTAEVLQRLVDHHTGDTLVVGPALAEHTFKEGEQPLNGRTTPWNTLALWSVRKLALTGFLSIADGLQSGKEDSNVVDDDINSDNPNPQEDDNVLMGSDGWWTSKTTRMRQISEQQRTQVPAGVEEVTVIALLQHLKGCHKARALLVKLPAELEGQVSWKTSWGNDERRKAWHEYKMQSKVARPAVQLQELFQSNCTTILRRGLPWCTAKDPPPSDAVAAPAPDEIGTVLHFNESIKPPLHVKLICMASSLMFHANFTAILAAAFKDINTSPAHTSLSAMASNGLLVGGVFLPIPLSLWLTRSIVRGYDHRAGFLHFAFWLLLSHVVILFTQLQVREQSQWRILFGARLMQGLGSGVLFQARRVLTSMSTSDHHGELLAWSHLTSDLGLGIGALLPFFLLTVFGVEQKTSWLLIAPSAGFVIICAVYIIWLLLAFPQFLHHLPEPVRFARVRKDSDSPRVAGKMSYTQWMLLVCCTIQVFVQSALVPLIALSMRDVGWIGNFRQTCGAAAFYLMPIPFEAISSRLCCVCSQRLQNNGTIAGALNQNGVSKLVFWMIAAAILAVAGFWPYVFADTEGQHLSVVLRRILEVGGLTVALAMGAPFHSEKLYQEQITERTSIMLEWLKAYLGRLLGPIFAFVLYHWGGYTPVFSMLCMAAIAGTAGKLALDAGK